jgi:hypothetical protein
MKLQLLFTFCSALVHSSFANHQFDVYCSVAGARVITDCQLEVEVTGESKSMDDLITSALDECVNTVTSEDVVMNGYSLVTRRELRGVNTSPQQRLLGQCDRCCCSEICLIQGYCGGTSDSCTQSCERRLEPEESGIVVAYTEEEQELSAQCTVDVIEVASMHPDNFCLGSVPSEIVCTVRESEHD